MNASIIPVIFIILYFYSKKIKKKLNQQMLLLQVIMLHHKQQQLLQIKQLQILNKKLILKKFLHKNLVEDLIHIIELL